MKDTLERFAKLKGQLIEERDTVEKRLAEINAVLGTVNLQAVPEHHKVVASEEVPENVTQAAWRGRRGTGKLTLAQAVLDAFGGEKGNGKSIAEILPVVRATAGKTHKVTRPIVNLTCLRLRDKGELKNVSRGVYALV